MHHKWQSNDVQFLRYGARQTEFYVDLDHFLPFYSPNITENQNFEKTKKAWRYYHFTYMYHKWQAYDVWLLRFAVWQTEFCVVSNQNFEKMEEKKNTHTHTPGDITILHMGNMNENHDMWFLRHGLWQTEFFVILGHFLLF